MAMAVSKRPATALSASVRVPTRVLNRSSNPISTGRPCLVYPLPPPLLSMAISVARRITTPPKEVSHVAPPDPRQTVGAETHRHGQSAQRADGVTGEPGAQFRRTPGPARR